VLKRALLKHLGSAKLLQVATAADDRPWICTVYFVHDDELNLYWLSWPERRHSQEISKNYRVAVAVAIKHDAPVIGIQAEGRAEMVNDEATIKKVMHIYVDKHNVGKDFVKKYEAGTNHHQLYKFTPQKYVLFDEQNFSGDQARQELII